MKYKSFIILSLSLVLLTAPVAAAEKPILTLKSATSAALTNSKKIELSKQEAELIEAKLSYPNNMTYYAYLQLQITQDQNVQDRQFLRDQISYNVLQSYNNLYLSQEAITLAYAELDLKNRERDQLLVKQELGLATASDVDALNLELKNLQTDIRSKEQGLMSDQLSFKLLTNRQVSNYVLENPIIFESFRIEGNVEAYFKDKINTYLKYNKELNTLQRNSIWDNFATTPTYSQ